MTSLLMIFFVLCMAALAIMTLQSVQVESALNRRTEIATGAYYEAAVQVERQLADIDARLAEAHNAADGDAAAYVARVAALQASLEAAPAPDDAHTGLMPDAPADAIPLSFAVPIGEGGSEIQVVLHVNRAFTGPRYTVARRMVVNIAPWDPEQDIGIYVPGTSD